MTETQAVLLAGSIPEPNSGCWLWIRGLEKDGYGNLHVGQNHYVRAHRASYRAFVGEIPAGKHVCHKCDQRSCINPDHLFLGDHRINVADKVAKNRQAKGHRVGTSLLSEAQVAEIRKRYDAGEAQAELAREFGVVKQNICHIVHRQSWRHV